MSIDVYNKGIRNLNQLNINVKILLTKQAKTAG